MASQLDHALEDLEQLLDNLHLLTPEAITDWASSYPERDLLYAIHAQLHKTRRQEQVLLELLQGT
jgi:hypothetical protein